MTDAHLTVRFSGPDSESALQMFIAWYLDSGDYNFRAFLEERGFELVDSDWTDDSIYMEITEIEYDDED